MRLLQHQKMALLETYVLWVITALKVHLKAQGALLVRQPLLVEINLECFLFSESLFLVPRSEHDC